MLGTLVYTSLDISFNVLLWTGKTTINGAISLYSYLYGKDSEPVNNQLMIEGINMSEINPEDIEEIKNDIKELKNIMTTNTNYNLSTTEDSPPLYSKKKID